MYLTQVLSVLLSVGSLVAASPAPLHSKRQSSSFDRHNATLDDFSEYALNVAKSRLGASNATLCTADKLSVRKSWYVQPRSPQPVDQARVVTCLDHCANNEAPIRIQRNTNTPNPPRHDLTSDERIAYTSAVRCLQTSQAKTPSALAPGAKTRYDDWIVTHINQTYTIHFNANFLGWHRWFVWEHEQALRNECGYTGYLPYWDWTRTAESGLANSPLFDGSETSMSGDGMSMNYSSTDEVVINSGTDAAIHLPPGTGGGCITSGPFVNYTLNLGPDGLTTVNGGFDNASYPFGYNPRCLRRSLTDYANQRFANASSVLTLLRDPQDVSTFETLMSGDAAYPELGVHGGGHWSLGKSSSILRSLQTNRRNLTGHSFFHV